MAISATKRHHRQIKMIQLNRWMRRRHTKNRIKEQEAVLSLANPLTSFSPTKSVQMVGKSSAQHPAKSRKGIIELGEMACGAEVEIDRCPLG